MALASCAAGEMPADAYKSRAESLMASGDRAAALEVLRDGIYRHPDDYRLNMLMGRTLLAHYTDLTPHARSRYLARYYFRRAAASAPDTASAGAALAEYERVRGQQKASQ